MTRPTLGFNGCAEPGVAPARATRRYARPGPPPVSIRFSQAEKAELVYRAGRQALGSYIKAVLFAGQTLKAPLSLRNRQRVASTDERQLAAILAHLGASRLASNLNQLARAANLGLLFMDEETRAELSEACGDVRAMRTMLMRALGQRSSDISGADEGAP